MDVTFRGRTARVRQSSGFIATARTRDVRLFLRHGHSLFRERVSDVSLDAGVEVTSERLSRTGVLTLRSAAVDVRGFTLAVDELQLEPVTLFPSERPADGCGMGYQGEYPRRVRARQSLRPRSEPRGGGSPLPVVIPLGAALWEVGTQDGSSLILVTDAGVSIQGWVPKTQVERQPTEPLAPGVESPDGEACPAVAVSVRRVSTPARLTDASGTAEWATLEPGTDLEVVPSDAGGRVEVIGIAGVVRLDRCERPLGWVDREALAQVPTSLATPALDPAIE